MNIPKILATTATVAALLVGAPAAQAAPAVQTPAVQAAPAAQAPASAPTLVAKTGNVRYVTASRLNIRKGAGTHTRVIGGLTRGSKITIIKTANAGRWGKLAGRAGWVALAHTSKTRPGSGGSTCARAAQSVLGTGYKWRCVPGLASHGLTNTATGAIKIRAGMTWSMTAAVARHERAHVDQVGPAGRCSAACKAYVTRWAGARDFWGAGLPTGRRPVEIMAWSAARCTGGAPSYERHYRHLSCTSLAEILRLR